LLIVTLSFLTGALLAFWMGVRHFVPGLLLVAIAGGALAVALGHPVGITIVWDVAAYALAQVGYACGLAAIALSMPGDAPFSEKLSARVWQHK
jgi:hypothetical protein